MRVILNDPRAVLLHGTAGALRLADASVDALVTDPPSGIGFMGKEWDHDRGGRDAWIAWLAEELAPAYRALKPGAHGLVWALPRTSHWTAMALELCGFEIRDRVSHLFLNGFPKSLDVSKAIDAAAAGQNQKHRPANRTVIETRRDGTNTANRSTLNYYAGDRDVTAPATDDAKRWSGWGTALKPALEDWWLVRKPLAGTVAKNVLAHGTGAINVDACRIMRGDSDRHEYGISGDEGGGTQNTYSFRPQDRRSYTPDALGRWPAHLVVGDGVEIDGIDEPVRFFYCPKPSIAEREAGLDHLPLRSGGEATGRDDDTAGLQNPRAGAGRGGGRRNIHPTLKSIALMRYLIRLITPPGGIVLDPFAGSGTTGIAALLEAARFVGVEQGGEHGEYLPILEGRIRHALAGGFEAAP